MMIGWIIFFAWLELYSAGIAAEAKRNGAKNYLIYLVPFAALFYVDSFTQGFYIAIVPVKKWAKTVMIFVAVVLLAQCGCIWAKGALNEEMAGYFAQIMALPVAACLLVYWLGTISSSAKILDMTGAGFPYEKLVCALLLPIPFLFFFKKGGASKKNVTQAAQ